MNNFERQEEIDVLVEKYTPRQLAGMIVDFEELMDKLEIYLPVSLDEILEGEFE